MTIAELIENWKKQRGEISKWPWKGNAVGLILEANGIKIATLNPIFRNHDPDETEHVSNLNFIASAPETIEALTKALEEASNLFHDLRYRNDWDNVDEVNGAIDAWLKNHGFVK